MIPVTISARELSFQKAICEKIKAEVQATVGTLLDYQFGTMIEIPRAALTADRMAREAQFFSFGTNDLTQMTFGFSRDDIGTFMGDYLGNKILDADPFQTIDQKAVGQLVKIGVDKGRTRRKDLMSSSSTRSASTTSPAPRSAFPSPVSPPPRPRSSRIRTRKRKRDTTKSQPQSGAGFFFVCWTTYFTIL